MSYVLQTNICQNINFPEITIVNFRKFFYICGWKNTNDYARI